MLAVAFLALAGAEPGRAADATVLEIENIVQTAPGGGAAWTKAVPKQPLAVGDRIRTRQRSRATLALTGLYTLRIDQFTTVEITPALVDSNKPTLDLLGGAAFIFSRERDGEIGVKMPAANAALRGTQLLARVSPDGKSFIQVLEGSVELSNPQGRLTLAAGEAGEAVPGQKPRRTAVIEARNILQWALYYPAGIDPADLDFGQVQAGPLAKSLAAYRRGNLLAAVDSLPARAPGAAADRLYHAAVLLAVGRLDEARGLLAGVPPAHPGKRALDRMLAAVFRERAAPWEIDSLATASEALAESYYLQAWAELEPARHAALRATQLAPHNGFAWVRLAELEFSAGRTAEARGAIEKGLGLTPENARAHALRGFILSADNRIDEARAAFEEAVRLDGGFGNGWLGLGLTKIKQGRLAEGRADLQAAATVEPTQSIFHSYLSKAMSQEGRGEEAAKDLALAAKLDPYDPTPPLYAALEAQRNNRPNAAIADLEQSLALTANRRIYRSEFLLDQDRAVRNANLARIYQNAGMREVALREAARAVENDYTNPSAHLFLANAFDAVRDPDRILLRHETPWFNELLLANLLSPVGGGPLSQFVSQQEYSKLLEADGLGGSLTTDWRSTSELRTTASLFGTHGNVSYGLDAYYRNDDGERLNSDMEIRELYGQLKWQASPDDTFYFLGKWATQENGDLFETYDNQPVSPALRFDEDQNPGLLLGGWNHRWAPGSHTLLLAGRLAAEQNLTDPLTRLNLVYRDTEGMKPGFINDSSGFAAFTDRTLANSVAVTADGRSLVYSPELLRSISPYLGTGGITNLTEGGFDLATRRQWEIHLAEIQHIQQLARHTILLGGRWQEGTIETDARLAAPRVPPFSGSFANPPADQHVESDYRRTGLYAYDYWRINSCLTLIGGLGWDRVEHPDNFRNPPVNSTQRTDEEFCGKLGFTWTPDPWFTLRGAAAQGLGGLSFDESVRLEPSQIAGFGQAYRTLISESLVGSVETPDYQLAGLAAEGKLSDRTWWGVSASVFDEEVNRSMGAFVGYDLPEPPAINPLLPAWFPHGIKQRLDYREQALSLTVNQLLGEEFAVGAGYRVTRSRLRAELPDLAGWAGSNLTDEATLHEMRLYGDWNSPAGWFAHLESNWFSQELDDDPARGASRAGDDFAQVNAWVGYRFASNLCELRAGVLNLGDADYQLSPLNSHAELARDRTFFILCRLSF